MHIGCRFSYFDNYMSTTALYFLVFNSMYRHAEMPDTMNQEIQC